MCFSYTVIENIKFFGLSDDIWGGAILGAVLGSLVIPGLIKFWEFIFNWWSMTRPKRMVWGGIADKKEACTIFVRDFIIPENSPLLSITPRIGVGVVPNVFQLWPDVEGRAVAYLFNMFGQIGKISNVRVVLMSQDLGEWNTNIIVLGAQAQKSFDFYNTMEFVGYRMDANDIFDNQSNQIVVREDGFGYGIILKSRNPQKIGGRPGVGFLIGGFGVLGTEAAAYYFKENYEKLGKEFRKNYFGIVVRARASSGEQSVHRLPQFDKIFKQ